RNRARAIRRCRASPVKRYLKIAGGVVLAALFCIQFGGDRVQLALGAPGPERDGSDKHEDAKENRKNYTDSDLSITLYGSRSTSPDGSSSVTAEPVSIAQAAWSSGLVDVGCCRLCSLLR